MLKSMERSIYWVLIASLLTMLMVLIIRVPQLVDLHEESSALYEDIIKQKDKSISLSQEECALVKADNEQLKTKYKDKNSYVYDFSKEEVYTLARCVEAEAGEDHFESQKYITQVILNRLYSVEFPNTIEDVIYQKTARGVPQFSVAYDGSMNREVKTETLANVYSVLLHGTDLPEYVLYFYSEEVKNNWVNTLPTYTTVEGTVFAYEEGSNNE